MTNQSYYQTPKWAKGPWEIQTYSNYFGWSIYAGGAGCIAERWYEVERTPEVDAEMKANAHLIAAAPELYEALKACHLQMLQSNNQTEYAEEANQMAIAAMAKARGESQ